MTALSLKPEPAVADTDDKQVILPPLPAAGARRRGETRARRRFGVARLVTTDSGLHPFRVN